MLFARTVAFVGERAGLVIQGDPILRQRYCAQLERHDLRAVGVSNLNQGLVEMKSGFLWGVAILDEAVAKDPMAELLLGLRAAPAVTLPALLLVVDSMQPQSLVDAYHRAALLVPQSLLESTLDALLRSLPRPQERCHIIRAQTATRSVIFHDEVRHLSSGEWRIFGYLERAHGRWRSAYQVSREALSRYDPTGVPLVWKYVSTLKKKLSFVPGVVESAPRRGYRLRPGLKVVR